MAGREIADSNAWRVSEANKRESLRSRVGVWFPVIVRLEPGYLLSTRLFNYVFLWMVWMGYKWSWQTEWIGESLAGLDT